MYAKIGGSIVAFCEVCSDVFCIDRISSDVSYVVMGGSVEILIAAAY